MQRHLYRYGVNYFSPGAVERHAGGRARDGLCRHHRGHIIQRTTLRGKPPEDHRGGTILKSQACIIGNRRLLAAEESSRLETRGLLEHIEAYLRARDFFSITANIRGDTPEEVAAHVAQRPEVGGLTGPTISRVYSRDKETWYAVTTVVPRERLLEAVDHLRQIGGSGITVFQGPLRFPGPVLILRDDAASSGTGFSRCPNFSAHLGMAKDAASRLDHPTLNNNMGAYLLGSVSPDIRIITRGKRDVTHFVPLDFEKAGDGVEGMFQSHPDLAQASGLNEPTRAFIVGFASHLFTDELWILNLYRPYFGNREVFEDKLFGNLMDRALQLELDRRESLAMGGTGALKPLPGGRREGR